MEHYHENILIKKYVKTAGNNTIGYWGPGGSMS